MYSDFKKVVRENSEIRVDCMAEMDHGYGISMKESPVYMEILYYSISLNQIKIINIIQCILD